LRTGEKQIGVPEKGKQPERGGVRERRTDSETKFQTK